MQPLDELVDPQWWRCEPPASRPGQQRTFTSAHGPVTPAWKLASTRGVGIGSLRAHAVAVNAAGGDTLVLVFRAADASLEAVRVHAEEAEPARLHKLLGHAVRNPAAALAAALDCRQEDVGALLRGRADDELAAVLDANGRRPRMQEAPTRAGAM